MKKEMFGLLATAAMILILISFIEMPTDTVIDASNIQHSTIVELSKFSNAQISLGLNVSSENDFITLAQADHKTGQGGPWCPVNGYKKTACGVLAHYEVTDGYGDEYDWGLNIIPDPAFVDVIQHAKLVSDSTCEWEKYFIINREYIQIQCDSKYTSAQLHNFKNVEFFQAEITPDEHLYDNKWFPESGKEKNSIVTGKKIGVYGPWVLDEDHGGRPEIHPCEVIWWKDSSSHVDTITIMGIQDDSNRFDDADDFSGTNNTPMANAWAKPPMKSIYKIPFEYDGQHLDHLKIIIKELTSRNVVTSTIPGFGDSDDGINHILRLKTPPNQEASVKNNIMVEVDEDPEKGDNTGVSFVEISKLKNGNIIGYVQIKTAYGKSDGEEGYQVLQVILNYPILPSNVVKKPSTTTPAHK